jgi:membrane protein DedA with SNARE-associated domain
MQNIIGWLVSDGRGYPVIFFLLLGAGLGIPIPEDVPLLATGVLATHEGGLSVAEGAAACGVFVLTRDLIVYGLGRRYGTALLRRPIFSRIAPEATVTRYQALIRRRAIGVVFCGRFVVGLRSAIFFAAGTAGVSARLFLVVDALAAMVSVPFFVWLGWRFASDLHRVEAITKDIRWVTLLIVGLGVVVWAIKMAKRRFEAAADQAMADEAAEQAVALDTAAPPGERLDS